MRECSRFADRSRCFTKDGDRNSRSHWRSAPAHRDSVFDRERAACCYWWSSRSISSVGRTSLVYHGSAAEFSQTARACVGWQCSCLYAVCVDCHRLVVRHDSSTASIETEPCRQPQGLVAKRQLRHWASSSSKRVG